MRTAKTLVTTALFSAALALPALGSLGCGGEENRAQEAMEEVEDEVEDAAEEIEDEVDDRT